MLRTREFLMYTGIVKWCVVFLFMESVRLQFNVEIL